MTTFQRIMTELTYGRSTDYIRRVARKARDHKVIDSTDYKAAKRSCDIIDRLKGRYVV